MNKFKAFGRKNWFWLIPIAFIVGVGSVTNAVTRFKQVVTNPRTAVTK